MKKISIIISVFIVAVILTFAIFKILVSHQKKTIVKLEKNINLLKQENTPIRFKVKERENGTVTVVIAFFDADNNRIKKGILKTFKGNEVSFDFYVYKVKDKYIAFPYKIYTDSIAPIKGDDLIQYYDYGGFPQIFYSKSINKSFKKGLETLFEKVKSGKIEDDTNYFGNMVHDIAGVREFRIGKTYKIITHTKGGIEITE